MATQYQGELLVPDRKSAKKLSIATRQYFVYATEVGWRAIPMSTLDSWQMLAHDLGTIGEVVVSARSAAEAIDWAKHFRP